MTREEQIAMMKRMREITGAGIVDCRKALEHEKWNMNEAIKYLKIMPKGWNHIDYFGEGRANRISK